MFTYYKVQVHVWIITVTKKKESPFEIEMHSDLSTCINNLLAGKERVMWTVKCTIRFTLCSSFWHIRHLWRPDARGVSLGGDLPTHPAASPLAAYYMRRQLCGHLTEIHSSLWAVSKFPPSVLSPSDWDLQPPVEQIIAPERTPAWELLPLLFFPYIGEARPQHASVIPCEEVFFKQEALPQGELPGESNW